MNVKCVLCNTIEQIQANSHMGKRLRHHPLRTYLCASCYARIEVNTKKRIEDGRLKPSTYHLSQSDW